MKKNIMFAGIAILLLGTGIHAYAEEKTPEIIYGGVEELADLKNHTDDMIELRYQLFGEGGMVLYDATENIDEVARFLSEMEIQEEVDLEASDCDEFFNFLCEDGTELVFWFNGKNFRTKDPEANYGYVTYKTEDFEKFSIEKYGTEMMEHQIIVDSEDETIIVDCPGAAFAGETVQIQTCFVADGEVKIEILDGDAGEFTEEALYEFVMPDHDITIKAWISTEGYAGS